MCPEGADISETYHKPAHIPGATASAPNFVASPAGAEGVIWVAESFDLCSAHGAVMCPQCLPGFCRSVFMNCGHAACLKQNPEHVTALW